MIIIDLPRRLTGLPDGLRVGVFGSCRIRNPFTRMEPHDEGLVTLAMPGLTHTAAEALQIMEFTRGLRDIPKSLSPYIFAQTELPSRNASIARAAVSADVYVVEVCDQRQALCGEIALQLNYLAQTFVHSRPAAMLPWYRAFGRGQPIPDEVATETLAKLEAANFELDDTLRDLVRNATLEPAHEPQLRSLLERLAAHAPGRWIVFSHFTVPGEEGRTMQDRRALAENLRQAATALDMEFVDPTIFIERFGREATLDGNGVNIYEYSEAFQESLAPHMREMLLGGTPGASDQQSSCELVETINARLMELHSARLAELGVDGSGLYEHFKRALERRALIGTTEQRVVQIVLDYLPDFPLIVVAQAAIGEVALPLAAGGKQVIASDAIDHRPEAITAGAGALGASWPNVATMRISQEFMPDLPADQRYTALLVAYSMTHLPSGQTEDEILAQICTYGAVLMAPVRLLRTRTAEEQESLLTYFRAAGFTEIREYPRFGLVYLKRPD